MSSGSLKQFLKKTKKNHKSMNEKVISDCMEIHLDRIIIYGNLLVYAVYISCEK